MVFKLGGLATFKVPNQHCPFERAKAPKVGNTDPRPTVRPSVPSPSAKKSIFLALLPLLLNIAFSSRQPVAPPYSASGRSGSMSPTMKDTERGVLPAEDDAMPNIAAADVAELSPQPADDSGTVVPTVKPEDGKTGMSSDPDIDYPTGLKLVFLMTSIFVGMFLVSLVGRQCPQSSPSSTGP